MAAVVKTSTRQTFFLPVIGLVPTAELTPGDLIGVNKDSYLVLEKLPPEYDSRVRAFEVDERPTEQYTDIGGLDSQIQELVEAIVLPMVIFIKTMIVFNKIRSSHHFRKFSDAQNPLRKRVLRKK